MSQGTILISYAYVDADFALALACDLKNAGVPAWIDRLDTPPEANWASAAQIALHQASAMIFILSPEAIASRYCRDELQHVSSRNCPIIPVILRNVPPPDWPGELQSHYPYDFSDWRDDVLYRERLSQLVSALELKLSVRFEDVPDAETRYLNQLISRVEARKGVLEYVDIGDRTARLHADDSYRRRPQMGMLWGVNNPVWLIEPRSARPLRTPVDTLGEALEQHGRLTLVGAPGVGKTAALQRLALDTARARLENRDTAPLPLLLHLGQWNGDRSAEDFIRAMWPFETDPLQLLAEGRVLLLLDGLNEANANRLEPLRLWLNSENAPQRFIIACRSGGAGVLDLPTVEISLLDEDGIQRFAEAALGENAAPQFLERLFPKDREAQAAAEPLARLARNTLVLAELIFLYKIAPHEPFPTSLGAIREKTLERLWTWQRPDTARDSIPFNEARVALGRLAASMLSEGKSSAITRNEVLRQLGSERMLKASRAAAFLDVRGERVRFHRFSTLEYFAARSLTLTDVPGKLTSARFNEWGERIATIWDQPIILMAGLWPKPDAVVREVAEVDPYLAGMCLASGIVVSEMVGQRTIASLMTYAAQSSNAERFAAAQVLYNVGQREIATVLMEIMRSGSWKTRLSAAWVLRDSEPMFSRELFEELADWNWSMDERISTKLHQIGTDAVPMLLHVVTADSNWEARRGAAWALGMIADAAAVPVLTEALNDPDALVRKEVATALRAIGDAAAVPALIEALSDPDRPARRAVSGALVWFKSAALPGLIDALRDQRSEIRQVSAEILGEIGDTSGVGGLLQASADTEVDVRAAAVEALGKVGSPASVQRLIECLSDTANVRYEGKRVCDLALIALEQIGTKEAKQAADRFKKQGGGVKVPPPAKTAMSLPQALEDLYHPNAQRRRDAAKRLGELLDPSSMNTLLAAAGDEDSQVRWAVVQTLGILGDVDAVGTLLSALRDADLLVVDAAAEALVKLGTPSVKGLIAALDDPRVDTRGAAVEALGKLKVEAAVPKLTALLKDEARPRHEQHSVGSLAQAALEQIGALGVTPVADSARSVSPKAQTVEDTAISTELEAALTDLQSKSSKVRQSAARVLTESAKALRDVDDPRLIGQLAEALRNNDSMVRWAVVESLGWIKDPTSAPILIEALHDQNWSVRLAAVRSLLEVGDKRSSPALAECLSDSQSAVREAAAEALGLISDERALPGLLGALQDREGFVRRAAAEALGCIGSEKATIDLIERLRDPDYHVRWAAAVALGRIGDPAAVEDLIGLLNDEDGPKWDQRRICDVVAEALMKIGTPEAINAVNNWRNRRA
jgi:HEAT repeat protein